MNKIKRNIPKKILWIWETICYSLIAGYIIKLILTGVYDDEIICLCAPTALFMLTFGECIYKDKVKWKKYKTHEWLIPLIACIIYAIYGLITNFYIFILSLGALITYGLVILVAKTQKEVQK